MATLTERANDYIGTANEGQYNNMLKADKNLNVFKPSVASVNRDSIAKLERYISMQEALVSFVLEGKKEEEALGISYV